LPLLTLLGFFTISAYHFGEADGQQGFRAIWEGSPMIWLPLLVRPDEVSELLAWIIPGGTLSVTLAWLDTAKPFLTCVAVVFTVDLALQALRQNWFTLTRGLLLVAIVVALPVLVSFGLFFCGWHSTRELWDLAKRMQPREPSKGLVQVLKLAAPRALGASALAGVGTWYFAAPSDLTPALVQAIFLGLSAVAVPHILLHAYAEQFQADPFERMVTA
jgi:Brp/Blh family beta-carotene 15,15'-monooxygenase